MKEQKKTGPVSVDLATLDTTPASNEGAKMEVLHPVNNRPIGSSIYLVGQDSELFRKIQRKAQNKRYNVMARRQAIRLTAEETDAENLDMLAACTLKWEGVVFEGQELPFSQENARMLYDKLPWLRDQVDIFIADRANFLAS